MNPEQLALLRSIDANVYLDAEGVLHIDFCSNPCEEQRKDEKEERDGSPYA